MMPGDLAPEDHGDLVGLPDGSIGVEQAFAELVEGSAAPEDEIVAEFDLREEQSMLAAGMFAPLAVKNGVRRASHFWPQVRRSQGVSWSASACRRSGAAEVRKALLYCRKAMPSARMWLASQWC